MSNFNAPLEAFLHWEKETPNALFLKQPIDGKQLEFTFKEAGSQARKIANHLSSLKLTPKSTVALFSKNCAHWIMSDLAIMMAGHISVPIYPTLNASSINQVLTHSESKAIIIGKLDDFSSQESGIPAIPKIGVSLYGITTEETWEDIVQNGQELQQIAHPKKDDLYTIIYTSGTTGNPKGVMHTVGNLIESSTVLMKTFDIPNQMNLFSYLPLAHVAERMGATIGMMTGSTTSFAESLDTFASDLERTQPYIFFAVPRIWTKFQEKILETIPQKKLNVLLALPLVNRLIKSKLKQKLGLKNAKIIVSSAAPISVSLIKWYRRLGIHIVEVYGMTEDCVISHGSPPAISKIGSVGKPYYHTEAKLSAEGEILVKNQCLMKGYYKEPELTSQVFTEDGFLRTGDIGEYDHDGYLSITGRVKDQFKTDKGKYISPATIELKMAKNTDIEQICVVGAGIPQPIALVTLSELGKAKASTELSKGLWQTVVDINPLFEKHEKLEKVVVMKEDWNVDNGLTTPTLKVKRNAIEKIHQPYYKEWFDSGDKVIFE